MMTFVVVLHIVADRRAVDELLVVDYTFPVVVAYAASFAENTADSALLENAHTHGNVPLNDLIRRSYNNGTALNIGGGYCMSSST